MTKVITIANLKAGVGKSELVKELSKYLLERGHRVLMVDTDIHQPVAFKYFKEDFPFFSNLTFINLSTNELSGLRNTLFSNFDYVVIDTMSYPTDLSTPFDISDMIVSPTYAESGDSDLLVKLQELVETYSDKVRSIDVVTYTDDVEYTNNSEIIEAINNIENINVLKSKLIYGKPEDSLDVLDELIENEYIEN